ncbi:hypothetical protein FRC01_013937 [Tulasnella sp. 417]|nr:hypothetical protein FRC01_013937 [Tulasnella sp. 417]
MESTSPTQEFDAAVERCTGGIMEFFAKLNGTGGEKTYEEVSAMLDKFDEFRAAIENSVRRKTAAWLRPWNSLAPAHKLPIEILQLTFHSVLFASSGRRCRHYVTRLTVLRSVSSIWRDVTDRTPSLWNQLSSQDHIDFVSEALSKSQNYSLQLKFVGALGSAAPSLFLDSAFLHLDRWEAVAIHDPNGLLMDRYLASPAPRLKRIVVSTRTGYIMFGDGIPAPLFGGELAGLEEFRAVRWKYMDWANVSFHRLRVLEIEDYFSLDMEKLFSILAENLDLRTLRIDAITFSEGFNPQKVPEPLILRSLTHFTFTKTAKLVEDGTQVDDVPVLQMLKRVQMPACTFFSVDFGVGHAASLREICNFMPSPIEIFQRRGGSQGSRAEPPTARITFQAGWFQCEALGSSRLAHQYQVVVRGLGEPSDRSEEWTRREFVDAWAERPKPDIQLQYLVDEELLQLDKVFNMQDIENVVELDVTGCPNANRLAQRLATPVTSDSGTVIGPFLGLRTLRFSNCDLDGAEVLRMVQDRFARVTKPTIIARQSTTGGNHAIPTEGGITIILGEGMDRFPQSIAREIRETPGVKQLMLYSDLPPTDDSSSSSSEESAWSLHASDMSDVISNDSWYYYRV